MIQSECSQTLYSKILLECLQHCGIIPISFCNVARCISVQCCIKFSPRSCIDDGRIGPQHKAFSSTSQWFSVWLRSGLCCVSANPCVKMMSHASWTTLSKIEPDDSWHHHLGPVVQNISSGSKWSRFGNPMFCYSGSDNPSYFYVGLSKQHWIGSPWSWYTVFKITKSGLPEL